MKVGEPGRFGLFYERRTTIVKRLIWLTPVSILMTTGSLLAATFVVPPDRELIEMSEAVIVATPQLAWSSFGDDGLLYTTTVLQVDDRLRGTIPSGSIEVTLPGGVIGDLVNVVTGSPALELGRQYILFLYSDEDTWSVKGHALGAFEIIATREGSRAAVRGGREGIAGWDTSGSNWSEPVRDADRFIDFIRGEAEGDGDYRLTPGAHLAIASSEIAPLSHYPASAYCAKPQGLPFRRPEFDSGNGVGFEVNGTHPGFTDTTTSVNRSMDAWNSAAGATIRLVYLGATTADAGVFDGTNTIRLGTPLGNNLAGRAILWSFSRTHEYGGETFLDIVESDVLIDSSYEETVAEEILAHELGHTVGFRHSDAGTPSSGNAVMTSSLSIFRPVLGPNLQEWDRDAASHVYGPVTCNAPTITVHPQSQTSSPGLFVSLEVAATGTAPISYQWYEGTTGNVSIPVGNNSSSYGDVLWTTTSFWVRVSNACGTASSHTATITIEAPCSAPVVSVQPASQTISSGDSAFLTVTASGTTPLSYQWYRGAAGDSSQPVGTDSSSLSTGPLDTTTSYWVRVSNSCGSASSTTAVITVESCSKPVITAQPRSQTVTAGGSTVLSVTASGSNPMSYQWYRGTSGDVSSPLGIGASVLDTGPLMTTTSFWVSITNECGTDHSTTAVVSVVEQCSPPVIIHAPQSLGIAPGASATLQVTADGTGPLTFQWYRGQSGQTTQPVGGNSSSLSTGPLDATTSFWVRVSNSCGMADSSTATVTVTEECSLSIVVQPSSQEIRAGTAATLSVEAVSTGGSTVAYQWYSGASGDVSTPLTELTGASVTTGKLFNSTSFWVRVTNGCTSVDSDTALVSVSSSRRRTVRRS
jgi:hypothetical protein